MHPERNEITDGNLLKAMALLALPIIFSNFLQGLYNVIDMFWVGKLGPAAVAAVSLSFPPTFLMIMIGTGISIAGTILVSQYKGRKDHEKADFIASQTVSSVILLSIVLAALGYVFSPVLLGAMSLEQSVSGMAKDYLRITFTGLPFVFFYFVFQSLLRATGNVRTPLYVVMGSILLNAVLDPLFIFGYGIIPAMGVAGAAIATVISQGLGALTGLYILLRGRSGIHVKLPYMAPHAETLVRLVKLGVPSSVEMASVSLSFIAMLFIVTPFGTEVTAAYGIGTRILSMIIIPSVGLGIATSTIVGQNMGAGRPERAEHAAKAGMAAGFVALTAMGILMFAFSKAIASALIDDATVVSMSSNFLNLVAPAFGFFAILDVVTGTFKGAGHTLRSMALTITSLWLLRFLIAYTLAYHTALSFEGIWWAFPISLVLSAFIAAAWFFHGSWKHKRVLEEHR